MSEENEHKRWSIGADHIGDGSYMKRWILRTPWFTLRLHKIVKSDGRGDFHDHPFHFRSFILKGGYREHRPDCRCFPKEDQGITYTSAPYISGQIFAEWYARCPAYRAGRTIKRRARDFHWIELLDESKPTWTFVVSSRYFREWGFLTRLGWIRHDIYKKRMQYDWGKAL